MQFISPGDSGAGILCSIGKDIILVFCMLLPFMGVSLEAQKTAEQELFRKGQETSQLENEFRSKYGPDQRLINGVGYYNHHAQSTGHKFYEADRYQSGNLLIDNRLYENLLLKYDIYNQQVLLLFSQVDAINKEIIINGTRLDGFQIGNQVFKKYYFPETDTLFFQVFEGEIVTFLYYWQKILIPVVSGYSLSELSKPKRDSYILDASGLNEFRSNGSFLGLFPEHRSEMKKFMRNRRINLRTASERQIRELHSFCNQILETNLTSQ